MLFFATLLAAAMLIVYLASTRRIDTDKARSILDRSKTKNDDAATDGEGEGVPTAPPLAPEYILASVNASECDPGYHAIKGSCPCREAASALGLTGGVSCQMSWHGSSFGMACLCSRGIEERGTRVTCKVAATHQEEREEEGVPTTPRYITTLNTNKCTPISQPIADASSCRVAADALGLCYYGSTRAADHPHGCHRTLGNRDGHDAGAWYNPKAGSISSKYQVICKQVKDAVPVTLTKFDRVRVIENVLGRARNRWVQEQGNSFQLVREDFGTVTWVGNTDQKVCVILDRDVQKEVWVDHTSLVKDDLPLEKVDNGALIEDALKNFPQAEDMAAFKCPITKQIFRVPVVASDGRTYEMSALVNASHGKEQNFTNYAISSLLNALAQQAVNRQKVTATEAIREATDKGYDDGENGDDRDPPKHIPVPIFASYEEEKRFYNQILTDKPPALGAAEVDVFECPLSKEFFQDPVVASDGHTYEREWIKRAMESNPLSPLTRDRLSPDLFPNRAMKLLLSVLILKADPIKKAKYAAEDKQKSLRLRKFSRRGDPLYPILAQCKDGATAQGAWYKGGHCRGGAHVKGPNMDANGSSQAREMCDAWCRSQQVEGDVKCCQLWGPGGSNPYRCELEHGSDVSMLFGGIPFGGTPLSASCL